MGTGLLLENIDDRFDEALEKPDERLDKGL
jgi:hypothetical protein